jgi:hypothetical protein
VLLARSISFQKSQGTTLVRDPESRLMSVQKFVFTYSRHVAFQLHVNELAAGMIHADSDRVGFLIC